MAFEELKQRQSAIWGNGPYQNVTETISDVHSLVIERLARSLGSVGWTWHAGRAQSPSWQPGQVRA